MGATLNDIFGTAPATEPATPGSYGEAPRGYRLPQATRLGPVHLQIADLARSLEYYQTVLGFRVVRQEAAYDGATHDGAAHDGAAHDGAAHAVLAAHGDDTPLVELHERTGTHAAGRRGRLGLYHYAILLPDRASLGRFVRHLASIGVGAGAGDHLVSEALYLQDPDGLGIEVYADRPRDTWRRNGRELMIGTEPVDMADLARAGADASWTGMPAGTVIGHVHLHVGDLSRAAAFFSEALGFDRITWRYPGALFMGAGGYHHHLGTNTWAGSGARPPAEDEARLLEWTIELPDAASLEAASDSLASAGHPVERAGDTRGASDVVTRDPWGTAIRIRLAPATGPVR